MKQKQNMNFDTFLAQGYCSTGLDNVEIGLGVSRKEARALRALCCGKTTDGRSFVLVPDKIFLRFAFGTLFANLNVPKLAFGHNVRLAWPENIATAVRILKQHTDAAVRRLDWLRAKVSLLHITHTREVPVFQDYRSLLRPPRGYWPSDHNETFTGDYFNSRTKDLPVCVYDKAQQIRDDGKTLPIDIERSMCSRDSALFRFEARINQSPYAQLKAHGGWNGLSLVAEDLISGGAFFSALTYLQWKFEKFIPIPALRLPTLVRNPSARAYAAHNTITTANENPEAMRTRAIADHNAGRIGAEVLKAELDRSDLLKRRERAIDLRTTLAEDCMNMTDNIRLNEEERMLELLAAQLETDHLETNHAANKLGFPHSISFHTHTP